VADSSSGALTFLFTDIEGSTRLLHSIGEDYAAVLAEHQVLMRDAFTHHNGQEIDTQGDSFFVVFPTPHDAIQSSIEAQRALGEHGWPDGVEVKVRIGMDTGPAVVRHDRYTGRVVHRAARVSAAGHGGQILVSDASELLLENRDGFSLRDLGPRRLKDIDGRLRIYQVEAPGLQRDFRGLNPKSFDQGGNYSLGIKEHIIFPEIDFDKAAEVWGMDITVCTNARNTDEARALLTAFNFPFRQ